MCPKIVSNPFRFVKTDGGRAPRDSLQIGGASTGIPGASYLPQATALTKPMRNAIVPSMDETKQFKAIVRGRVQGVFYRATAVDQARALGLAGYARNRPDGSVEVVARGAEAHLRRLLEWLHSGPTLAQVTAVDVDWTDTTAAPDPFTVRY